MADQGARDMEVREAREADPYIPQLVRELDLLPSQPAEIFLRNSVRKFLQVDLEADLVLLRVEECRGRPL
jgi:hypothetical protein